MNELNLNQKLLIWINQDWANPVFDLLFEWLSMKEGFSIPLIILITLYIIYRYGKTGWILGLLIVLVTALSDLLGNMLKDVFQHPRPCLEFYDHIRYVWGGDTRCTSSTSGMPSNHALNFFATFTFISCIFPKPKVIWASLIVACLVSISRIYLGEHFPSQVLAGMIIGFIFGLAFGLITNKLFNHHLEMKVD